MIEEKPNFICSLYMSCGLECIADVVALDFVINQILGSLHPLEIYWIKKKHMTKQVRKQLNLLIDALLDRTVRHSVGIGVNECRIVYVSPL